VRLALLRQLERHAGTALQVIYHDLNAHLVERRILPDVRPTARRTPPAPGAKRAAPADGKAPSPAAPDLFGTLAQLLGAATAASPAAGAGGPSGAAAAGAASLLTGAAGAAGVGAPAVAASPF